MEFSLSDLRDKITRNWVLILLFILSTSFFLYQHYTTIPWDFSAYVLNAKYIFGSGSYFEHYRAPLPSFLLGTLSIFGWKAAEYLFIVLVSFIFLISTYKLSKALGAKSWLIYLISLSPYVLLYGTWQGTELLSLALLELFVAFSIEKKSFSSFFLGLACLTRYNFLIFLPLLLFYKDWKKIFQNITYFTIPFIPFFLFQLHFTGNMFTSIANSYMLNVKMRGYLDHPLHYEWFFGVLSYLLPFFLIGIYSVSDKIKNTLDFHSLKVSFEENRTRLIALSLLLLSFYQYYSTPFKAFRYLFPLVLPIIYFSYQGVKFIKERTGYSDLSIKFLWVGFLIGLLIVTSYSYLNKVQSGKYEGAISVLRENDLMNCELASNDWVVMNYLGKITRPYPRKEVLSDYLNDGGFALLFYGVREPVYVSNETFLNEHPKVYEGKGFVLLGNNSTCVKPSAVDSTYTKRRNNYLEKVGGEKISADPCRILFEDISFLESFCAFVNKS